MSENYTLQLIYNMLVHSNAKQLDQFLSSNRALLKNKINILNSKCLVAVAVCKARQETIPVLLKHGADINKTKGRFYRESFSKDIHKNVTPLWIAAATGRTTVLKLLLQYENIDVNASCECGLSPILASVYGRHKNCFSILIATDGVDAYAKTNLGRNGLMLACKRNLTYVAGTYITHMIRSKGDLKSFVNDEDATGKTALHFACNQHHLEKIAVATNLIALGSEQKADYRGITPIMNAAYNNNDNIINSLGKTAPNARRVANLIKAANAVLAKFHQSLVYDVEALRQIFRRLVFTETRTESENISEIHNFFITNYSFREPITSRDLFFLNHKKFILYAFILFERYFKIYSSKCLRCFCIFIEKGIDFNNEKDVESVLLLTLMFLKEMERSLDLGVMYNNETQRHTVHHHRRKIEAISRYFLDLVVTIFKSIGHDYKRVDEQNCELVYDIIRAIISLTSKIRILEIDVNERLLMKVCRVILDICLYFPLIMQNSQRFLEFIIIPVCRDCCNNSTAFEHLVLFSYTEQNMHVAEYIFDLLFGNKNLVSVDPNKKCRLVGTTLHIAVNMNLLSSKIIETLLNNQQIDVDNCNDIGRYLMDDIINCGTYTHQQLFLRRPLKCLAATECAKLDVAVISTLSNELIEIVMLHKKRHLFSDPYDCF